MSYFLIHISGDGARPPHSLRPRGNGDQFMCVSGKGRVERAITRLEIVQHGEPIHTREWLEWAFPRRSRAEIGYNQYFSLWRALKRTHVFVRRERKANGQFGPAIWRKRTADDPPLPPRKRWDKKRNPAK